MSKTERTCFTPERIAEAKHNIEHYEWAHNELQTILEAKPINFMLGKRYTGANHFVKKSDDELFAIPPSITLRRKYNSMSTTICPVHGTDIRRDNGVYPWLLDFDNQPYKVKCPVGGEIYPSNNFAAGDMTSGEFPDDGSGFTAGEHTYDFISYYVHSVYNNWITPGIHAMGMAYMLMDDPRYGHNAAVLLAALAAQYPGPHFHSEHCYEGAYDWRSGMVTDYIWENVKLVDLARAYDAIYPVYDRDPELLEYLRKRGCVDENAPDLATGARKYVEDRILRQAMQALMDRAVVGNPGHHQLAALTLGLVMNDHSDATPNTRDVVWDAYHRGYAPAACIFTNFLTRDGGGYEGPGYDRIKFNYVAVGKLMERLRTLNPDIYNEQEFPPILHQPKAREMWEFFLGITSIGSFIPEVGDVGGGTLIPRIIPWKYHTYAPEEYVDAFALYGNPRHAKALLGLDGKMPPGDVFDQSVEHRARKAAASPEAEIESETRLLDHYGFAYLNAGKPGRYEREACINYTALRGHEQHDYLSLYLYAHEISHLPDLGYPYSFNYRWQWDSNLYGHNTVAVDGCSPLMARQVRTGWVSLVGDRQGVQVAVVAHEPYHHNPKLHPCQPPVTRYERICVMVGEDERESYLLDLFVVQGGLRHDQSWHGVLREPTLPDLDWEDQEGGTAAGPDVPFNGKYVNLRGQETQDALCYVTGVKHAELREQAVVEWEYGMAEPAGLRMHLTPVDGSRKLIYGGGRSPERPENWSLPFIFVRHEGGEGLTTRFLTVLEPYRKNNAPRIHNISTRGDWPLKVEIQRAAAVDEIHIHAPSGPDGIHRGAERDLGVMVRTTSADGRQTRCVNFGYSPSADAASVIRGKILAVNREENTVTIAGKLPPKEVPGHVRIFNANRSSQYRVLNVKPAGDNDTLLHLRETSLLGQGVPTSYQKGRINNDVCLPFATGVVDQNDNLHDFPCRFTGARVENADRSASLLLSGVNSAGWINGERDYNLYLQEALPATRLEELFGAPEKRAQFSIHDYGAGDCFEILGAVELHTADCQPE